MAGTLFAQVCFHVIETDIPAADVDIIREALNSNGATEHTGSPSRNVNFELEGLSHVIAATIDFEGYSKLEECFINVVRPDWVYNALSKSKLPNPKSYSADPRMIFSGLSVCVASDIPDGEKDAIVGGVLAMGGIYAGQMSRQVTHLVSMNMDTKECRLVTEKKLACRIVLPHWFDDCLRISRRIDEGPYTLPEPELLEDGKWEMKKVERPDMVTAMYLRPGHLPDILESQDERIEELDVFSGKKIFLHKDLDISGHLRGTLEDLIAVGGGQAVSDIADADTLVCHWREGKIYRTASQQGKIVGNLSWLYHIVSHNRWTSPLKRLLHYPFSKDGIPGFANYKLSLSNYSGESRVYLENLARAAGSTFTKAFKMENTHLITAHERSEKVDAAKEWGVYIVNHLWLEDCYAKWEIQPINQDRYTYMPPRTNMGEVVGQTPIDKVALEKHFYPGGTSSPKYAASLKDSQEDSPDPVQDEDVFMTANGNEEDAPTEREDTGSIMQDKDVNADKPKSQTPETPAPAKRKLGRPRKADKETPKTPAGVMRPDGKENEIPASVGRSAKSKAAAKLQSMAGDIQQFQKEMKRAGGVTHGGRRNREDLVGDPPSSRKRSASPEGDTESDASRAEPVRKKAKGPPSMRLLITGWGGGKANEAKAALRNIGIMLTEEPSSCSHLAASRIVRTKKFTSALAYGPTIVNIDFVEQSLERGEILDVKDYPLKDAEGEKKYKMNLTKSVERARANRGKLFRDMSIFVTKDINGGYDTFEDIIKANGGQPFLFQGRPGAINSRRAASESEEEESEIESTLHLVRGDSTAEAKLGEKFLQMAEKAHWKAKVVTPDWLLNSALAQELKDEDSFRPS